MAQKVDPKEIVTIEELAHSNYFQLEVMFRLLVKRGIITKQEYIGEMMEFKADMATKGTVE
ncbi:MAG: hypothetical protein KAJ00_00720 [Deltaproteobacteria bacterium]|nr:hypothetical protein [Deltaproteobacteria bacterium]